MDGFGREGDMMVVGVGPDWFATYKCSSGAGMKADYVQIYGKSLDIDLKSIHSTLEARIPNIDVSPSIMYTGKHPDCNYQWEWPLQYGQFSYSNNYLGFGTE